MADKNRTEIDWQDVRTFLALARYGSLSAAARTLDMNHASISRRCGRRDVVGDATGGPVEPASKRRHSPGHPSLPGSGRWPGRVQSASAPPALQQHVSAVRIRNPVLGASVAARYARLCPAPLGMLFGSSTLA